MSRVLKGEPGASRVLDGTVVDARTEAARILEDARARAAEIVASAEAAREESRRQGLSAGREEGLAEATALSVRVREVEARRLEDAESDLRRLAVRIAEKILGRELALSADAVVSVVRTAIDGAARSRRELVIHVHPDDVEAVAGARERLSQVLVRPAELAVRGDASIRRGGCRIETEAGTIDARLDVQLAAIERALVGSRG